MGILKRAKESRKIFYGWFVAAASAMVMFVAAGTGGYTFSVFLVPLLEEFYWPRAQASFAYSLKWWLIGFGAPLAGLLLDRYGGRVCLTVGVSLMSLGMLALSTVSTLPFFYLFYALVGLGGALAIFVPNYTVVSNWFIRRRGLALAICVTGSGLGAVFMPRITDALIEQGGWRWAYQGLALLIALVSLPPILLVIRHKPEDIGLRPDGDPPAPPPSGRREQAPSFSQDSLEGFTLKEALRTRAFWLVCLAIFCLAEGDIGILSQVVVYLTDQGYSREFGARVLSFYGFFTLAGRYTFGYWADRWKTGPVMTISFFIHILGPLFLLLIHLPGAPWAFAACFGIAVGSGAVLAAAIEGWCFGRRELGKVMGITRMFST
ncbi:MAG: MFS transporter, partial [Candidatus Tectomicrobia bacterium]|nr:MFS transporter [Candidatus Tectomicrobia bacterium]